MLVLHIQILEGEKGVLLGLALPFLSLGHILLVSWCVYAVGGQAPDLGRQELIFQESTMK